MMQKETQSAETLAHSGLYDICLALTNALNQGAPENEMRYRIETQVKPCKKGEPESMEDFDPPAQITIQFFKYDGTEVCDKVSARVFLYVKENSEKAHARVFLSGDKLSCYTELNENRADISVAVGSHVAEKVKRYSDRPARRLALKGIRTVRTALS